MEDALRNLRVAVLRRVVEGDDAVAAVNDSVKVVAHRAHERGLMAEQLVVAINNMWRDMVVSRDLPKDDDQAQIRAELVTAVIGAYYLHP